VGLNVNDKLLNKIKDTIQDCNVNFLMGSGLSAPFLGTLGNIEILLTQIEDLEVDIKQKRVIRASLYKKYFDLAISNNLKILESDIDAQNILNNYCDFLKTINGILLQRKSTILSKEVNIFTTNVDIFLEKALEDVNLEYNDGFNGRFAPCFDLSNLKKSHFKRSLQYDNSSELPVFNLLKLHGSLSWIMQKDKNNENQIKFSNDLGFVKDAKDIVITDGVLIDIPSDVQINDLITASEGKEVDISIESFMKAYEKLPIINPTKEKFKQTLLNQTHYELLRIYSNELEKENSVLFVMGFSFSDEHIREITLRAANSNPTLIIYVIGYSSQSSKDIQSKFGEHSIRNQNIEFISPPQNPASNSSIPIDKYQYNLPTINKEIFQQLFKDSEMNNEMNKVDEIE
jgi:hypothetical protein